MKDRIIQTPLGHYYMGKDENDNAILTMDETKAEKVSKDVALDIADSINCFTVTIIKIES